MEVPTPVPSRADAMATGGPRFAGTQPMVAPGEVEQTRTELAPQGPWRVVVLNDPVNSMSYVVLVFRKVFGFPEPRARKHMLEVHEQGRSVVWSGLREQAELYAFALQQWHLTAILESDEAH
ncbi:MAG: ATP-dependent Clp protease adaptor ClpS [Opitutaceae bacterium]|nr:ATP-dependent Clp protease adaptor ClpS [Opitutaceae bacterium]